MFYWYIVEKEKQDEDIEFIDSFILRLCYGHIKDKDSIVEKTKTLLQKIWNVRSRLAQGTD